MEIDSKYCKVCGSVVKIEPVCAGVDLIDLKSICSCGNDVLKNPCGMCDGAGCPSCMGEIETAILIVGGNNG